MKTFRGVVRVEETGIFLDAGGVEVRLVGERERFVPLDGLFTTIVGEQDGDAIRDAAPALQPEAAAVAATGAARFEPVIAALTSRGDELRAIPGVVGARPGFRSSGGELTEEPAIIVAVDPSRPGVAVPAEIGGVPVETRPATAAESVNGFLPLSAWQGVVQEGAPEIGYKPPDPSIVALDEVRVHNITCHVGPDSGWSTLKTFLEGTTQSLTVAMYEFYAQHVVDTVTLLGEETDATLNMILQVSGNDRDIEEKLAESWRDRLSFTRASVSGPDRIFNNSYHTKVAVRDSSAFWLSSGNWSPLSQPLIPLGSEQVLYKKGNREWHVIVEDETLAQMFEKFIEYDISEAQAVIPEAAGPQMPDLLIPESLMEPEAAVVQDHPFAAKTLATSGVPVRVKPLMSPDNYAVETLKLIESAERSLYLQFSYISQPSHEKFDEIITAIAGKMADGLDVRVLVGGSQDTEHSEILVGVRGWKRSMFRKQKSKVHNKGILVDGKIAVVGSNNWSSDGTQYNRDASLIFYSRPIARYFTEVFLFDWDNLSRSIGPTPETAPVLAPEAGPTPLGMVRIPWRAWYDE
jgi:phosphatidylserine/phosphatidylglycerophosphate/cardiolipin synthase-like enzyme